MYNDVGELVGICCCWRSCTISKSARMARCSTGSGCGNDMRSRSSMALRLIIDSCAHLIETYGIDGFRSTSRIWSD
ncbi:MAG: hypothetical protein QM760_16335 [Nibricoccus sp.]